MACYEVEPRGDTKESRVGTKDFVTGLSPWVSSCDSSDVHSSLPGAGDEEAADTMSWEVPFRVSPWQSTSSSSAWPETDAGKAADTASSEIPFRVSPWQSTNSSVRPQAAAGKAADTAPSEIPFGVSPWQSTNSSARPEAAASKVEVVDAAAHVLPKLSPGPRALDQFHALCRRSSLREGGDEGAGMPCMRRSHSDPTDERLCRGAREASPLRAAAWQIRGSARVALWPQRAGGRVFSCRAPCGECRPGFARSSFLRRSTAGASSSSTAVAPEDLPLASCAARDGGGGGSSGIPLQEGSAAAAKAAAAKAAAGAAASPPTSARSAGSAGFPWARSSLPGAAFAWGPQCEDDCEIMGACRSNSAPGLISSSWLWEPWRERSSGLANTLASTLGSVPLKAPTPTFFCPVCMENVPVARRASLEACSMESHATCQDCLRTYLDLRIKEGRVDDLRCPCASTSAAEGACGATASREELRQLLTENMFEKYERFSLMRANPQLRACPSCHRLRAPDMKDGATVAEMHCVECDVYFCYYHSNAHPRGLEACAEYERACVRQQLLDAGMYGARSCPRCSAMTQKVSGCNHMTCRCGADWCWVCRRPLSNVGWHYNPANPNGCMQFQDELTNRREGILMVICKIVSLPAMLCSLVFLICFAACMAITVLVPIAFCFKDVGCKVWIWIAICIVGLPFLLFCFAWGIVGVAIWLTMLPCGVGEVHLQFFVGVPLMTNLALCEGIIGPRHAS